MGDKKDSGIKLTPQDVENLKRCKTRITLTNEKKNLSLIVDLGIVDKYYGGTLSWSVGLPFLAVFKHLQKRDFYIKRIVVIE